MKLKLSTKFMRGFVAKRISKAIEKKLGYKIDIQLNEIGVEKNGDKIHIHVNVEADTNYNDVIDIIGSIGED